MPTNQSAISTSEAVRRWVGNSKNWLTRFMDSLPACSNYITLVAMGSAVRERGHPRSDFDVLLVYKHKRPSFTSPIEVDIRSYAKDEIEEKLASGHEVIGWAMKFGVPLYDKELFWHTLQSKWEGNIAIPSAAEAFERAHMALLSARQMLEARDESAADDLLLAAITQFVREKLIRLQVFPASRPELPSQLLAASPSDPLAQLLEDAMYADPDALQLFHRLGELGFVSKRS